MEDQSLPYWQRYDWDGDGDVDEDDARVFLSRHLLIRLTDPDKNPLPLAKCRIVGDPAVVLTCDTKGIVPIPVPDSNVQSIDIEWEPQDAESVDPSNRFYWQTTLQMSITNANDDTCATRLVHLGFNGATLRELVMDYQNYFGLEPTGTLSDIREEMVAWHDGGNYPQTESAVTPPAIYDETDLDYTKISIQLCNPDGNPILQSQWFATLGNKELSGSTENGRIDIENTEKQPSLKLKWNDLISQPDVFFEQDIFLALGDPSSAVSNRLHNLGYFGLSLEDKLADYREDFNYSPEIDDTVIFKEILEWHDGISGMPPDNEC